VQNNDDLFPETNHLMTSIDMRISMKWNALIISYVFLVFVQGTQQYKMFTHLLHIVVHMY